MTIAYWFVVAGPDANLGVDTRRGVEVAIEDKGGRLLDHPIRLIGEDTGCNAAFCSRTSHRWACHLSSANRMPRWRSPSRLVATS